MNAPPYLDYRLKNYTTPPPGGFRAKFPRTGWNEVHDDYHHLVSLTEKHLKANGIDQERASFIVEMSTVRFAYKAGFMNYLKKVKMSRGISQYWKGLGFYRTILESEKSGTSPLCQLSEAARRTEICRKCPRNTRLKKTLVDRYTESIMRNKIDSRPLSPHLHQCDVCTCELNLLVHLSKDVITSHSLKDGKAYPPQCWKRALYTQ